MALLRPCSVSARTELMRIADEDRDLLCPPLSEQLVEEAGKGQFYQQREFFPSFVVLTSVI